MTTEYDPEQRQVYTPREYMALTGLCKTAVYQGIERGEIPSVRIGRRILVLKTPVDRQLGCGPNQPTENHIGDDK
jgi:excisionase family DNA binding protein